MNQKIDIQAAFRILGIYVAWAKKLQQMGSYSAACKNVEEFKKVLKKRKRQLMLQYHPDRNNGDVESANKTKEILNLCSIFENIQVMRQQPIRQTVVMHYQFYQHYDATGTTASSTWY